MSRNRKRVQDAREYLVGPMPVAAFIDAFLPPAKDKSVLLSPKGAFNAVPRRAESPAHIYLPLLSALNKATKKKSCCPGFTFDATCERSIRPLRLGYMKPHICCFTPENAALVAQADPLSRSELGYAEFFIDIKADATTEFFADPPTDANANVRKAHDFARQYQHYEEALFDRMERTFGVHLAFATEIFARQHRLFLFTISMAGSYARFFRWDRAGCVVSEAFDILDRPDLLVEFLWRFSRASATQRGHDPTVEMASPQEEILFREAIRSHLRLQLEVTDGDNLDKVMAAHYQPSHVEAIHVYSRRLSSSNATTSRFLVSRPIVSPLSIEGRGTRGYWAVCLSTGSVVFLKDTWRARLSPEIEGEVLQRLNELGVRYVPTLIAHGDISAGESSTDSSDELGFQRTQTSHFLDKPWVCRIDQKDVYAIEKQHYRLVTSHAGYGLKTIRGTEELLYATHDAFTGTSPIHMSYATPTPKLKTLAVRDALALDSRIHRDLSVGNIILFKEPSCSIRKGYLVDWDASDRTDSAGEAVHQGRAGTWEFMSIRMLSSRHADRKHSIRDDMEAMLYVVFYCGLRYLAHNLSIFDLTSIVQPFFREVKILNRTTYGGECKLANAECRDAIGSVRFGSAALEEWLRTVMDYHSPAEDSTETHSGMWDPERLDAFWTTFLATHTLERDDRVFHRLSMSGQYDLDSPESTPVAPPPEDEAFTLGKRRVNTPSADGHAPESKKARHDATTTPSRTPHRKNDKRLSATSAPRRSERLLKKRQRVYVNTSPTRKSAPKLGTASGGSRLPSQGRSQGRLRGGSRK
ncbi:hypothetical protein C8Q78DRAFT_1078956 [Trametes maxima]|nr:hypothetical protein C8Q78DRAFT_1078956 [Trametes maxima]